MNTNQHKELLSKALNIKLRFLAMHRRAQAGHLGCSLSVAEILTYLRFHWMQGDDEIILSKGHAGASLYATLAEEGVLSEDDILSYYKNGTYLGLHPPANKIPKIPFATGSLGHGLSLAAGLGLAQKLKRSDKKIFCVTSDGELNEGSTWEAAMFVAHHSLTNVVWLIDRNRLQGYGRTEETLKLEPLDKKLEAFGFRVLTADGHDFASLDHAKLQAHESSLPNAVICHTLKGHGWTTYEDLIESHYLTLDDEQHEIAVRGVRNFFERQLSSLS